MKLIIPPERLAAIKARVPMPALVSMRLKVSRAGHHEYLALCPFHTEQTPSFRIYRDHAHCFGCSWHGDQFRWLMTYERMGFVGAVQYLCNWSGSTEISAEGIERTRQVDYGWHPILPVPEDAPALLDTFGRTLRVFNPKRAGERNEWSSWRPAMAHPYRSATGALLGYVLRINWRDGRKFTPTVTFCEGETGERRWCITAFPRPLPLYRLDQLAQSNRTVILVEGKKTADAAARLLPQLTTITWPGGSKSYRHVDFSPLSGREVVCVPDADRAGRDAFYGRSDNAGKRVPGILQILTEVAAVAGVVEPERERPDGWI